jgi:hypothetical protein
MQITASYCDFNYAKPLMSRCRRSQIDSANFTNTNVLCIDIDINYDNRNRTSQLRYRLEADCQALFQNLRKPIRFWLTILEICPKYLT